MVSMIFLLSLLLVASFIHQLVIVIDDFKQKKQRKWKITLIVVNVAILIIGIVVIVRQQQDNQVITDLTNGISKKVKIIDSMAKEQINNLNLNIDKSEKISKRIDSVQASTNELLSNEKKLLTQYQSVNERLRKQIEIDYSKIKENRAIIEILDENSELIVNEDSSKQFQICISNSGGRNAEILGGFMQIIVFDINSKPLAIIRMPYAYSKTTLAPNSFSDGLFCYSSHKFTNSMNQVKSDVSFAIIKINVKYKDVVIDSTETLNLYKAWIPKNNTFCNPRQWQIKLFDDWIEKM